VTNIFLDTYTICSTTHVQDSVICALPRSRIFYVAPNSPFFLAFGDWGNQNVTHLCRFFLCWSLLLSYPKRYLGDLFPPVNHDNRLAPGPEPWHALLFSSGCPTTTPTRKLPEDCFYLFCVFSKIFFRKLLLPLPFSIQEVSLPLCARDHRQTQLVFFPAALPPSLFSFSPPQ